MTAAIVTAPPGRNWADEQPTALWPRLLAAATRTTWTGTRWTARTATGSAARTTWTAWAAAGSTRSRWATASRGISSARRRTWRTTAAWRTWRSTSTRRTGRAWWPARGTWRTGWPARVRPRRADRWTAGQEQAAAGPGHRRRARGPGGRRRPAVLLRLQWRRGGGQLLHTARGQRPGVRRIHRG